MKQANEVIAVAASLLRKYWWVLALINVLGTLFGFWYYRIQLSHEPLLAWPVVPDSPTATFFFAVSLVAGIVYGRGDGIHALAFLGGWKFGIWTPAVLLLFMDTALATTSSPMYIFLVVSHLGMAAQALLIPLYADVSVRGVGVAVGWYVLNDIVDYFVPIVGTPHHTTLPEQGIVNGTIRHVPAFHTPAAALAIFGTATGIILLSYWVTKSGTR